MGVRYLSVCSTVVPDMDTSIPNKSKIITVKAGVLFIHVFQIQLLENVNVFSLISLTLQVHFQNVKCHNHFEVSQMCR